MSTDDACFQTISEAAERIRSGQMSPVEIVEAHLKRIDDTDAALNSFITVLADNAMASARVAENEKPRRPRT